MACIIGKDACIKCGACVRACPVRSSEGALAFPGPRRLAAEVPRFDDVPLEMERTSFLCTTCHKCSSACPAGIDIPYAIGEMRRHLNERGEIASGHVRMVHNIDAFGRSVELTSTAFRPIPGSSGPIYFPGCIGSERLPRSCEAVCELIEQGGKGVIVPNDLVCCGSPLEKIGERERSEKLRETNIRILGSAEGLITSCPGCTVQLRAYGLEPMHIIEHLYEDIGINKLRYRSSTNQIKIALHRPCHLVRSVGPHVIDYAIELLQSSPRVRFVEMEDADSCCGGGGGVASAAPDVAMRLAKMRTRAAANAGADILLAPCPFCTINLGRAGDLRVEDFYRFLLGLIEGTSKG